MKGSSEESEHIGGRRIAFVALPNFFAESMIAARYRLRSSPFVVTTGTGDRARILDTYNLPTRGLLGATLGRLEKLLPLDSPNGGQPVYPDIVPVADDVVHDMDHRARLILGQYADVIESSQAGQYHVDLGAARDPSVPVAAREIAGRLGDWLRYSVRLGLGSNKLISYLAGRRARTGKAREVPVGREANFYRPLSVLLLPLAWKLKQELYAAYNVRTIGELAAFEQEELERVFGRQGVTLYRYARGIAPDRLESRLEREWLRDEIDIATTLDNGDALARSRFSLLLDRLSGELRRRSAFPGRFALEAVYQDDYRRRVERRLKGANNLAGSLLERIGPHLDRMLARRVALKKISLGFADCSAAWWQYDLYDADGGPARGGPETATREREISAACDLIRDRFGAGAIQRASQI